MTDPILLAYALNGDGEGTALSGAAISDGLKDDQLAWVHLDAGHQYTAAWLAKELNYLDPFIVPALTAKKRVRA